MAESYSSQLVEAMDRLWFHQVILSSEPTSVLCSKTALHSSSCSSSESFLLEGDNNNASTIASTCSISQSKQEQQIETEEAVFDKNDLNKKDEEKSEGDRMGRKRPSRLDLIGNKVRSKSSSPSIHHCSNNKNNNKESRKLQRFLSCSKLHDLELEELKGFMDLGFKFEKDHLSPQTMRVLPGLQRLEGQHEDDVTSSTYGLNSSKFDDDDDKKDEGENSDSKKTTTEVGKPYLSESWLVKRPNSPLLRLRMARVSTAEEDMKKCLKLWARTVASSVQPDE